MTKEKQVKFLAVSVVTAFIILTSSGSARASFETRGLSTDYAQPVRTFPLPEEYGNQPAQETNQRIQPSTQPIQNAPQYVIQSDDNVSAPIQIPAPAPENNAENNADQAEASPVPNYPEQSAIQPAQNLPPLSPYPPSAPPPPLPATFTVQPVQNTVPAVHYAVQPAQQNPCNCTGAYAPHSVYQPVAAVPLPPAPPAVSREDRTIYFGFSKANLNNEARAKLNSLATRIVSSDNVTGARITGYADRIGPAAYNERLSRRRAENVRNYLVERGFIKPIGTATLWVGKSQTAAQCPRYLPRAQLLKCLQPDRKVEVQIQYRNQVVAAAR